MFNNESQDSLFLTMTTVKIGHIFLNWKKNDLSNLELDVKTLVFHSDESDLKFMFLAVHFLSGFDFHTKQKLSPKKFIPLIDWP